MGRKALRVLRGDLPTIDERESSVVDAIRSSLLSSDVARVDNALSGNGRHIELHQLTGITRRHIQRVLAGEANMSFEVAVRIADAAGVTLDELRLYIYQNRRRSS